MNRRDLLVATGGAGLVGGIGYVRFEGQPAVERPDPIVLTTIDAPGSSVGEITTPVDGTPTLVEFFATTCRACSRYMSALTAAHETVGADVTFVSVTHEPVGVSVDVEDVRRWWIDHDGSWTVALDPELALTDTLDVAALPTTVLFDSEGTVQWHDRGTKSASKLVERIDARR